MIRISQTVRSAAHTLVTLAIVNIPVLTTHAEWIDDFKKHCSYTKGGAVLVSGQTTTFPCYLELLLHDNIPYVLLAAIVLVIASGLQYMLAQGNPGEQGKAKQRIVGIIAGIVFYFLIQYLIPLVTGGIHL